MFSTFKVKIMPPKKVDSKSAASAAKMKAAKAEAKVVAQAKKDLDALHAKKVHSQSALAAAKKQVKEATVERNNIAKQTQKLANEEKKLKSTVKKLKK